MMITQISAFEFDNVKSFDEGNNKISIINAFGFGATLAEYQLNFNTDQCLIDCRAEGTATLYEKDYLFSDTDFVDKKTKKKDLPYDIYYYNVDATKEVEVLTYETTCETFNNGTGDYDVCERIENGSYMIEVPDHTWIDLKPNKKLEIGNYSWKLKATKSKYDSIDWGVGMFGISTDEVREHWAWWNSSWIKKKQYNLTESLNTATNNQNRSEAWDDIVSGLDIVNCTDEIRILDSTEDYEIPSYAEHINTTACHIYFRHQKNDTTTNTIYYIYYDNAGASYPSYITNLSYTGTFIGNKNYNITYNNPFDSNANTKWFLEGLNTTFDSQNGVVVKTNNVNGRLMNIRNSQDSGDWIIQSVKSNEIFVRIEVNSTGVIEGFYNVTFFHDVDQWKYSGFNNFSATASGMRLRMGWGNTTASKCVAFRKGNDTYTDTCAAKSNIQDTTNSYFDYRVATDQASIFFTWLNKSGNPDTNYSHKSYMRVNDYGDHLAAVSGTDVSNPSGNINEWEYIYMGFVDTTSNSTDDREEKFWTLRTPPTSSLGSEEAVSGLPDITLNKPTESQTIANSTVTFNCSTESATQNLNLTLFIDGIINQTVFNITDSQTFLDFETDIDMVDGNHNYTCIASDGTLVGSTVTRNFLVDSTYPLISLTYPLNQTYADGYVTVNNTNITIIWNYTESNVSACWYTLNVGDNCYQEFANESTDCGGVGSGNYDTPSNYFYINYTKPVSVNNATWNIKFGKSGANPILSNVSIPETCFNNSDTLQLRYFSNPDGKEGYGQCYNNTWSNITTISSSGVAVCSGTPVSNTFALYDGNWTSQSLYSIFTDWDIIPDSDCYSQLYEESITWLPNKNYLTCTDKNETININYTSSTLYFYINDTSGNENSSSVTFRQTYAFQEINKSYNATSIESLDESFTLAGYYDPSYYPTISGLLRYNNTAKTTTTTLNGNLVSLNSTVGIPLSSSTVTTNNSFYWNITVTNATSTYVSSNTTNQSVAYLNWSVCNLGDGTAYTNLTFISEGNNSRILGAISSSSFIYYLDNKDINRTYLFTQASAQDEFRFCLNPDYVSVNVIQSIPYLSTGYPLRTFDNTTKFDNITDNIQLFLLSTADGLYVTFQLLNPAEQALSDVHVTAVRSISGVSTTLGEGDTDAAGGVTFWLNPDFSHTFTFNHTSYPIYTTSFAPTQSSYTVQLGGASNVTLYDFTRGIDYSITPKNFTLLNDTVYNFTFALNSSYWTVNDFGFVLKNSSGTIVAGEFKSANEGTTSVNYNVGNTSKYILLEYYWNINGNYTNSTSKYYYIRSTQGSEWSITNFFNDFKTYATAGLFGLDDFGKAMIIFIIIFMFTGIMSYKFGLTSTGGIAILIFGIVAFFDVGLNMIDFMNPVHAVPNFPTIFLAAILFMILAREWYN